MSCKTVLTLVLLFCLRGLNAQELQEVKHEDNMLSSVFTQFEDGTKEGIFKLLYRDQIIEQGVYKNNKKVGKWQYYNFNRIVEFEYDYDVNEISKIGTDTLPSQGQWSNTPCFFQGSPLVPYLYMVSHVFYPTDAVDQNLAGRIVLTLKIDKNGKIYGFYLSERLHHLLDKAVMDVARELPKDWTFFPATRNGAPLISEYSIAIEFEL